MENNQLNLGTLVKREQTPKHQIRAEALLLNPFRSLKKSIVYVLNRSTILTDVVWLLDQAKNTVTYSMYARCDPDSHQVKCIAIEFRQIDQFNAIVLVIDLVNVPDENTYLFAVIKFLLLQIFKQDKRSFVWNDKQVNDLVALVDHKYLPRVILECIQIIRLEPLFKHWYNRIFPHNARCFVPVTDIDDSMYCTCPHRPYKQCHAEWILLKALAYTFNEYCYTVDEEVLQISRMVQFSVRCCAIITKLTLGIELDWTKEQLCQFKTLHSN